MAKIVQYTVNVGDYDTCTPENFDIISDVNLFKNNARNSRLPKILVHKFFDCDFSIYLDANRKLKEGITKEILIDKYLSDADMIIMSTTKTVDDEARLAVSRLNNEWEVEILAKQKEHYKKIGVSNLTVCGFQPLVRRHSSMMEKFCEAWWAEMCKWSYRDQVSFPVIKAKFPELKFVDIDMGELFYSVYKHGSKTFPKYGS